jgi:hypothetical protein
LDFLDEDELVADHGDVLVFLQELGDLDDLVAEAGEAFLLAKDGELEVEHEEVEALGFLFLGLGVGREAGDIGSQVVEVRVVEVLPGVVTGESFDNSTLGADDEVPQIDRRNLGLQESGRAARSASMSAAGAAADWRSSWVMSSRRVVKRRLLSDSVARPSTVGGFAPKNSRLPQ